jgi:hypothetical protein
LTFLRLIVAISIDRSRAASARPPSPPEEQNFGDITASLHIAAPPVGGCFSSFFVLGEAMGKTQGSSCAGLEYVRALTQYIKVDFTKSASPCQGILGKMGKKACCRQSFGRQSIFWGICDTIARLN